MNANQIDISSLNTMIKECLLRKLKKDCYEKKVNVIEDLHRKLCSNKGSKEGEKDFYNKFLLEIKPLSVFLKKNDFSGIEILEEGRFDARVWNNEKQDNVECTSMVDGHQRELLMEMLDKGEFVCSNQEIQTNGKSKASGQRKIFQEEPIALESKKTKSRQKESFKQKLICRFSKKEESSNEGDKDALLIISFYKSDYRLLCDDIFNEVVEGLDISSKIFKNIYIIGVGYNEQHYYKEL